MVISDTPPLSGRASVGKCSLIKPPCGSCYSAPNICSSQPWWLATRDMGVCAEMGLTGECYACFLFIYGSTCGKTGHFIVALVLYQGVRRVNTKGRGRNC